MIDDHGRNIEYLRISLTDRCNLRCVYCMPEQGVQSFEHNSILSFEEILRIARIMTRVGVRHIRITGGEPMARKGCLEFVSMLRDTPGIETISMTTNAILLDGRIGQAKAAGLTSLNISMDTNDPETFAKMTRGGEVATVKRVIDDAIREGIKVKINVVPVREFNEGQLTALASMAKEQPVDVRFIELMPLGCGAALSPIPSDEVLTIMERAFGPLRRDDSIHGLGPARYVKPAGFIGSIGVISPLSHEFCDQCNRVRLTSVGYLKLCLNHTAGLDLREMVRSGKNDDEILSAIYGAIAKKPKRHGFNEPVADRELLKMNSIGG